MKLAHIRGAGIAGLTTAQQLLQRGWRVELHCRAAGAAPLLVLKEATVDLLCQVWQTAPRDWPDMHPLSTRIVDRAGEQTVHHESAFSIDARPLQEYLFNRLRSRFGRLLTIRDRAESEPSMSEGWQIDASGRPAATCGDRRLIAAVGALRDTAPRESACFEALPEGWLFTAPVDRDRALVQLMIPASGEVPDLLRRAIAGSHLARALIADLHPDHWTWAAAPAFRDPSPGVQCLRVGDAAFAVDPICGDGTGHAIRGALLAAAVVDAVEEGGDPEALRAHYQRRLRYAFIAHLRACVEIYATLPQRSLWAPEVEQMSVALRAIDDQGLSGDSFCYRLVGTALHRVSR